MVRLLLAMVLLSACGRTAPLEIVDDPVALGVDAGRPDGAGGRPDASAPRDLAVAPDLALPDLSVAPDDLTQPDLSEPDFAEPADLQLPPDFLVKNPCGNYDPGCGAIGLPNPLPFSGDGQRPNGLADKNVERDKNGAIILAQTTNQLNFLWIAGTNDIGGRGTLSKIDSRSVKEVARYVTATCYSNPGGGRTACDGTKGCCSRDDFLRFQDRTFGRPESPRQAVQVSANYPSRTALDWNGDAWVANRAFGGQSSVTKISNGIDGCTDWNKDGVIETSSDVNGDGVIDVDCNNNGTPDDIDDVRNRPCANGQRPEFYGLDDECILFTTNTNYANQVGRPLTLQPGATPTSPSDAWAGTYNDGKFFQIDGSNGSIRAMAFGPSGAYGATVDKEGILWVAVLADGRLFYIDTGNPQMTGRTRGATFPLSAYGLSLDRDSNIWEAGWTTGNAYRYSPQRGAGFAALGQGYWTVVQNPGANAGATGNGRGIAADNRTRNSFFVWMARDAGWIVRLDGTVPLPVGADATVSGVTLPATRVAGSSTIGAGLDFSGNVWGVSYDGSVATRIKVDGAGAMTAPDIAGGRNNAGCPVGNGDRCTLGFKGDTGVNPYTYSDFSGYGLRNFTQPRGSWSMVVKSGCAGATDWLRLEWSAVVTPGTTLLAKARSGATQTPDNTWTSFTAPTNASPAALQGKLGAGAGGYLQAWFDFTSFDGVNSAALKSFNAVYQCR